MLLKETLIALLATGAALLSTTLAPVERSQSSAATPSDDVVVVLAASFEEQNRAIVESLFHVDTPGLDELGLLLEESMVDALEGDFEGYADAQLDAEEAFHELTDKEKAIVLGIVAKVRGWDSPDDAQGAESSLLIGCSITCGGSSCAVSGNKTCKCKCNLFGNPVCKCRR